MFVTVRYGEDQSKIFNINCRNETLLHQIKKRCKMDRDETIELSDEHGTVKNLRQNLHEYGKDYLKERETLVLLRVDSCNTDADTSDSLSDRIIFIPMLTNFAENQDFIESLNPRSHMGSKSSLLDEHEGKARKAKKRDKKLDKKPKTPAKS